jgi:aldose 1-epimerase
VKGYDHAFLLQAKGDLSQPAAHLWSSDNRLQMSVYTTAPALQFYSGNFLEGTPSRELKAYEAWQGLALESELLPDSPNHPEWPQPDCVLRPGEEYLSITEYQFIPS